MDMNNLDEPISRNSEGHVKESTRPLNLQRKSEVNLGTEINREINKKDPISDAIEGNLKHKDIVEYGYQIKDGKRIPLEWSYIEIGKKKWFICTSIIAKTAYSKNHSSNWQRSDLKKALDNNEFELYVGSESPLGKDERIDTGLSILSRKQYLKIKDMLPKTLTGYWLRLSNLNEYTAWCVLDDGDPSKCLTNHICIPSGVRPAFRLNSEI